MIASVRRELHSAADAIGCWSTADHLSLASAARPNMSSPDDSVLLSTCSQCARQGPVRRCARCLRVAYCSPECQKEAWKAGHKTLCHAASDAYETVVRAIAPSNSKQL